MSKKVNNFVPSFSEDDDEPIISRRKKESGPKDDGTVDVNGFHVLVSQENQVREMFKKHPDLTSNFSLKNQKLKNAYMDVLLGLIETLCQSTKELSLKDLDKAENTLIDLNRAGLKVDWLRQKFDEVYLKYSGSRIRELEKQVKKRKLNLSDLEAELQIEKAAALAAKARIGFRAVV